ncbi:MAG: hypothetical protein AAFW69_00180 [Pseudomonadota bacterium]
MRRTTLRLWLGLALLFVGVLAWHQPLRGPLTEAELRAAFGPRFAVVDAAADPRAQAMLAFFRSDDGRPFYMLNLNAEPEADTPEGAAETAAQARAYAGFMAPRLLVRASYPVLLTDQIAVLNSSVGAGLDQVDRLVLVRYRSRRDFLEIISTLEFQAAVEHKARSLDGWYSAPVKVAPVLSLPALALVLLVAAGLLGTVLIRGGRARTAG